jgi:hypothetical protein
MQLLLTMKMYLTTAVWMPVRLSASTLASANGCGGPWCDVLKGTLKLMEDILSTYYKLTLSDKTHKLNVSGQMLLRSFFLLGMWNSYRKIIRNFQLHPVYITRHGNNFTYFDIFSLFTKNACNNLLLHTCLNILAKLLNCRGLAGHHD